jgi:hypothetical protein
VLVLDEPVPAGVAPAPLRCPRGQDLVSREWWAFGFPASAGEDETVRLWDPQACVCLLTVPTHYPALALAWVADSLAIGLDTGLLVIKPAPVG